MPSFRNGFSGVIVKPRPARVLVALCGSTGIGCRDWYWFRLLVAHLFLPLSAFNAEMLKGTLGLQATEACPRLLAIDWA
jgi:hypothetical protein